MNSDSITVENLMTNDLLSLNILVPLIDNNDYKFNGDDNDGGDDNSDDEYMDGYSYTSDYTEKRIEYFVVNELFENLSLKENPVRKPNQDCTSTYDGLTSQCVAQNVRHGRGHIILCTLHIYCYLNGS